MNHRLTLWQLMVWLTGCGVYFAAIRGTLPNTRRTLSSDLVLSLLAAGVGLGWVGVMQVLQIAPRFGADRRLRGNAARMPVATPGTWLLATMGLIAAVDLVVDMLSTEGSGRAEVIRQVATCLVFLGPTLSRRLPRVWRSYFMVLALHEAVRLVVACLIVTSVPVPSGMTTVTSPWVRSVVALIGLALVIGLDRQERQPRDWLHFAGILVGAAFFIVRALIYAGLARRGKMKPSE